MPAEHTRIDASRGASVTRITFPLQSPFKPRRPSAVRVSRVHSTEYSDVTRELIIGASIGSLGILALVFGVQGYLNPEAALFPAFADPTLAAVAVGAGLFCCMLEVRILLPVLKTMSASASQAQRTGPNDDAH